MSKQSDFYRLLGLEPPPEDVVVLEEVNPYMPEIYMWGQRSNYAALVAEFGGISWAGSEEDHPDATHRFEVAALWLEEQPNPDQVVEVIDESGNPVPGIPIVRAWAYPGYADASCPDLPDWTGDYPQTTRWTTHGTVVKTDGYGLARMNMGRGDAFFPDRTGGGFSCVYPAHFSGEGHIVHRLGWLDGRQYPAVRVIYRMVEVGGGPGPGPSGFVRLLVSGIELVGELLSED